MVVGRKKAAARLVLKPQGGDLAVMIFLLGGLQIACGTVLMELTQQLGNRCL